MPLLLEQRVPPLLVRIPYRAIHYLSMPLGGISSVRLIRRPERSRERPIRIQHARSMLFNCLCPKGQLASFFDELAALGEPCLTIAITYQS